MTSAPAWRERPSLLQSRASRPRGGFSFQFNDLSEGAFSFEELDEQVQSLLLAGQASGEFSTLYTQFIPSSPAFALSIDRSTMGALNIDFQQAMQAIAILAGGNDSGLTYDGGQVRNISVQAADSGRSQLEDILSYYVGNPRVS